MTDLTADPPLIERVRKMENVRIYEQYKVVEFTGENTLSGVTIRKLAEEETISLAVKGAFIAIGLQPNSGLDSPLLKLNAQGEIIINADCSTSCPGIFAAGDVTNAFGHFFLRDTAIHRRKLYVGESAGFQDQLWGFGMRYAVLSGYLAAKSLMDGKDYDMLWKRELRPMIETSLVNRYLFEKFGHTGYRYLVKRFGEGNPCEFLRKHYNYFFFKHLLLPLAKKRYESRVKDKSCNHEDCACVWCRCGVSACP
jgi:hypothetical protein